MHLPRLHLPLVLAVAALFAACGTLGGAIDQPAPAAVQAEIATFDVVAPALVEFVEADAMRAVDHRVPPAGRTAPDGRSDAELAGFLGLVEDWQFRLQLNAEGVGLDAVVEIPPELPGLKEALLAGAFVPATADGGGQ